MVSIWLIFMSLKFLFVIHLNATSRMISYFNWETYLLRIVRIDEQVVLLVDDEKVPATVQHVHRFVLLLVVVALAQGQDEAYEAVTQDQKRFDDFLHQSGGEELYDSIHDFIDHTFNVAGPFNFFSVNSNIYYLVASELGIPKA